MTDLHKNLYEVLVYINIVGFLMHGLGECLKKKRNDEVIEENASWNKKINKTKTFIPWSL